MILFNIVNKYLSRQIIYAGDFTHSYVLMQITILYKHINI